MFTLNSSSKIHSLARNKALKEINQKVIYSAIHNRDLNRFFRLQIKNTNQKLTALKRKQKKVEAKLHKHRQNCLKENDLNKHQQTKINFYLIINMSSMISSVQQKYNL